MSNSLLDDRPIFLAAAPGASNASSADEGHKFQEQAAAETSRSEEQGAGQVRDMMGMSAGLGGVGSFLSGAISRMSEAKAAATDKMVALDQQYQLRQRSRS
jgi:hypothetical protein